MDTTKQNTVPVELDISDWDHEILCYLICESVKRSVPVDQILIDALTTYLEHISNEKNEE